MKEDATPDGRQMDPPPVTMTRVDGFRVYRHGDDGYFLDMFRRFKAGELEGRRINNAMKERDLFLIEDGGRKYVLKWDHGGWGFGGERPSERFLLRLLRGPFYSRLMKRVRNARIAGCDMIANIHLVAERRTLHYCHEAVIILDYLEGGMLIDKGDPESHRGPIRDAMLRLHAGGLALCDVSVYNFLVDDDGKVRIIDLVCRGNPRVDRIKDVIRLKNVLQIEMPVTGWLDRLIHRVLLGFQDRRRRRAEKYNKMQGERRLGRFR